jgi:hypothetical protein
MANLSSHIYAFFLLLPLFLSLFRLEDIRLWTVASSGFEGGISPHFYHIQNNIND